MSWHWVGEGGYERSMTNHFYLQQRNNGGKSDRSASSPLFFLRFSTIANLTKNPRNTFFIFYFFYTFIYHSFFLNQKTKEWGAWDRKNTNPCVQFTSFYQQIIQNFFAYPYLQRRHFNIPPICFRQLQRVLKLTYSLSYFF